MLEKNIKRLRRQKKVRAKISWTSLRPRLAIFRSNSNIYAQIIDDQTSTTLVASSDLKLEKVWTKTEMAKKVWEEIAKKAIESNLKTVVFDRGGFSYHGRVKALAEWARSIWLEF
jgi:large subunit ribosomal protein L18